MIIAFTVNDRPEYLRQTLESWSKVRGIENAYLVYQHEPDCPEALRVTDSAIPLALSHRLVNKKLAGVLRNPWLALKTAFEFHDADFAILAEEDLVVSPDVLEYFTWCQRYRDDPNVLGVTTYQHHEQPGGLSGVREADWSRDDQWHFWVWGTWRDRWQNLIRDDWDFTYRSDCGCPPDRRGWDWWIRNHLIRDAGMKMIAPSMCRSQHIGKFGGAHCTPDQFDALLSSCYAGPDVPPQEYKLIE